MYFGDDEQLDIQAINSIKILSSAALPGRNYREFHTPKL